jgi:predicted secreted protein
MTTQGGYGTKLKIDISNSMTLVTRAMDIEFPEFEKVLADVTTHDSPGGYAEHIATGKRKMNSFTVKLLWDADETTHAAILAAFNSDEAVEMSVEDPDSQEVITFDAHVWKVGRVTPQEEGYTCDVAIQPTGIPVVGS